jgi:SAM-dependent methyltransferase
VSTTANDPALWFKEHYDDAADEILDFLRGDGITLEGQRVADIGCGDGIIDLGLAIKGSPEQVVGYDLMEVDSGALLRAAKAANVVEELPECLSFGRSEPTSIPAPDGHFDVVVTWSVFEHVDDPVGLLREVRRILNPHGVLFLQLWPFYASEHGGHLWPHYDEPFPHLLRKDEEILEHVEGRRGTDPRRSADDEYHSLNRITLEDLQRALLANRLMVSKLKLIANTVHVPRQLANRALTDLGVGGIELLASPV